MIDKGSYLDIRWGYQNANITDAGVKVLSENIAKMSQLRELNLNLQS